jgi:CheY-like chemotaxis protein
LTGQIQTFSRGQIVEPRVVRLNEIVGGMESLLERIIGEDVQLTSALEDSTGCVRVDPGQLEQVIVNLAVNARDAMPGGGSLRLETRRAVLDADAAAEAELPEPGTWALLEVSDTGTGMDAAVRGKIFEPFFTTKGQGQGTGLGLAIVYGILRQSGGGIAVDTAPGRGTRFRIYLPPCAEEEPEREVAPAAPQVQGGSETILVVEDEPAIRGLIERLLGEVGYHVLVAGDTAAALAIARRYEGEIHLLLSDVVLPGGRGWDLEERLRDLRPELVTLFMSGYAEAEPTGRGRWQPPEALLRKPFTPVHLRRRVREVLDQARVHPAALPGR